MTQRADASVSNAPPCVVTYAIRERTRAFVKRVFPRRKGRVITVRAAKELELALKTTLVDAVIVDLSGGQDDGWRAAALARDFPTAPFFGFTPLRGADASSVAQCARLDFADILVDGVDDGVARSLVLMAAFSTRFSIALKEPPPSLHLHTATQLAVWSLIVTQGGRPLQTSAIAAELGMTREHLSRSFSANGGPNLKRIIDLVRLLAAAELAKNPGLDLRDVACVLDFASPSHLSTTAQRIAGSKSASLSRLRAVDLIDRFMRGHERSRG